MSRCLIVPGLSCSGPGHWQTIWEAERKDCLRVEMGCWDDPSRAIWVAGIDRAVREAPPGVILVAHSLGCLAVAWWALGIGRDVAGSVRGAMLVAPPDVDRPRADARLVRFAPTPRGRLPFPAFVVASRDDRYATLDRSAEMAAGWGATLVDIGHAGHINAASGLGDWQDGQRLLDELIGRPGTAQAAAGPGRRSLPPAQPSSGSDARNVR